ncbi:NADPH-dependent FMN reductase [Paenibacillus sp. HJL G12]|uniref:NADPH-dependent FMN reductase n=1 Tax=Paenibacillus dendrobii TaxID=2691084 RepID=A0A7X3ILT6_9BACL|nr:NADPH-dependent FMN reductase [Paenibacillus dendrobii]MWV45791.1 NADPH-dependent FMN reductase [Paenibacillus dendrobii]
MRSIVILNGGPSLTSRLMGVVRYAEDYALKKGHPLHRIDVVKLPAEDLILARIDSKEIASANRTLAEADAVIIASPVFQASYTGLLKTFLDTVPQKGLAGKMILPLLIGGSLAHLLAMDYALKPVLSAMGARHILGGVFTVDTQITRISSGEMILASELIERLDTALEELSAELGRRSLMRSEGNAGVDGPEACTALIGSLRVQIQ